MEVRVWLGYDLGVKGDYPGLYAFWMITMLLNAERVFAHFCSSARTEIISNLNS